MAKGLVEAACLVESLTEGKLQGNPVGGGQSRLGQHIQKPLQIGLVGVDFADAGEAGICDGQIGTDFHHLIETGGGFLESAKRFEGHAKIVQRADPPGLDSQCPAKALHRFFRIAFVKMNLSHRLVRGRGLGRERSRKHISGRGFVETFHLRQNRGHLRVNHYAVELCLLGDAPWVPNCVIRLGLRLGAGRLIPDLAQVGRYGLFLLPLFPQRFADLLETLEIIRLQHFRAAVGGRRLVEMIQLDENIPHFEVAFGVAGPKLEGFPVGQESFVQPPFFCEKSAEILVCIGEIGPGDGCPAKQIDRLIEIPALQRESCQHAKRIGLFRLLFENPGIDFLRLGRLAGLLMANRRLD